MVGSKDNVLKDAAEEIGRWDRGSIFTRSELVETIQHAFGRLTSRQQNNIRRRYNDGKISRRQFLKVLGFGVGGAFVASSSVSYFMDKNIFNDSLHSITGYATIDVSSGQALDGPISDNQGQSIVVPSGEYVIDDTIPVDGSTELIFEDVTIDPGHGNIEVIGCDGSGWRVGGNCSIVQHPDSFVRFGVRGSGQFGDQNGRIMTEGHGDPDGAGVDGWHEQSIRPYKRMFTFDRDSGDVTIMNVTHLGVQPGNHDGGNAITWTDRGGTVELVGCDIRQAGDNGFYAGMMEGRIVARECYFENINVGALRVGPANGALMEDCCVVVNSDLNIQSWSGGRQTAAMTVTDYNDHAGTYEIRNTQYIEGDDISGNADFVRLHEGGGQDVVIENCQWTGHPDNRDSGLNYSLEGNNGGNPDCEPPTQAVASSGTSPSGGDSGNGGTSDSAIC